MIYAQTSDLMLGDMVLGKAVAPEKYLREASEDIDIALGELYEMPFNVEAADAPERTKILLRRIAARLASGRLILAQAVGGEDTQLQAYGQHLIEEAETVLTAIKQGSLELEGPVPIDTAHGYEGPTVKNHDSESGVDTFYDSFLGATPAPLPGTVLWRPGE